MADREDHRGTPYAAVVRLTSWAAGNRERLRIAVARDGIDPTGWSAAATLELIYTYMVDDLSSVWVPSTSVREEVDKFLADPSVLPRSARRQRRVDPDRRKNWGRSPEARAGQAAAMAMFGGPAVPRPEGGGR